MLRVQCELRWEETPENACCVQQHFKIYCVKSKTLFRRFLSLPAHAHSHRPFPGSIHPRPLLATETTNNRRYKLGDLLFFGGRINAARKIAVREARKFLAPRKRLRAAFICCRGRSS